MSDTEPRDPRFKYLSKERFHEALSRVRDVKKERLLLSDVESRIADEITPKIAAASRAHLNRGEGVSPVDYLRKTSGERDSVARGYAVALIITWRDDPRGMRPSHLDAAARALGEVLGGLTAEEAEVRDLEQDIERQQQRIAAMEAEVAAEEKEQARVAALGELARRLSSAPA